MITRSVSDLRYLASLNTVIKHVCDHRDQARSARETVVAYPPYLAAALSGATPRQLGHWRRGTVSSGAVLIPELSARRPILYSFRDLVALRTCVYLRKDSSLQMVRRAIGNLRTMGELGHLSEYTLVSDGKSIFLVTSDSAEMSDVLRPFVTRGDIEVPALFQPRPHIAVHPDVRSGHPVIAGTRVPYENVAGLVADGIAPADVRNYYPAVDARAAEDALDFSKYVDNWRPTGRRQNPAA
jgi:uncharacterized protein (DUF433 family)